MASDAHEGVGLGEGGSHGGPDARVVELPCGSQEFLGKVYRLQGNYFALGKRRLHRVVYAHFNGPIPRGKSWHVHHIDGNRLNNQIENLELLSATQHMSGHGEAWDEERTAKHLAALDRARPMAAKWHRSAEGRKWHSDHAKRIDYSPRFEHRCEFCGAVFLSSHSVGVQFCSKNCKTRHRYHSGVDDETRACAACGGEFVANRYARTRCCSRACGRSHARRAI